MNGYNFLGKQMFSSTKRLGPISTCHRNWKAECNPNRDSRKCAKIHGYSRYVQFTFSGELDERDWVMDFGDCKDIKVFIEGMWDHKVLVSSDDPEITTLIEMNDKGLLDLVIIPADYRQWGPGIEGSCKWVYDVVNDMVTSKTEGRVKITKVEIWEHENNSAFYEPNKDE